MIATRVILVFIILAAVSCRAKRTAETERLETRTIFQERVIELPGETEYVFYPCDTAGIIRPFLFRDTTARRSLIVEGNAGGMIKIRYRTDTIQSVKIERDTTRVIRYVERTTAGNGRARRGRAWRAFVLGSIAGAAGMLFLYAYLRR